MSGKNEAQAIDEAAAQKRKATINGLQNRVERLETLLVEIFHFLSEETRPIFGLNGVGLLFDAVEKRLKKEIGVENDG